MPPGNEHGGNMFSRRGTRMAARLALCAIASAGLIAGCAGGGGHTESGPDPDELPEWVRIVPSGTDEMTYYVGGCSSAADEDEGVACARDDAVEQLGVDARDRFQDLFNHTLLDSRTQTTSMERLRFKTDAPEAYLKRLDGVVQIEDTYHILCADGSICSIYALVTVSRESDDAVLSDVLGYFHRIFREEGSSDLAELAELMQRAIE